jgi:hypothetical protein
MVNRFLSSMGITLDNFGAKPLKTNEPQACVVVDALQIEPVSNSNSLLYLDSTKTREAVG